MHDVHHTLKIKVRSWARGYTAFSHATHSAHVQQDCHTDLKVREDKLLKDIMNNETVVVTYEYVPRKKQDLQHQFGIQTVTVCWYLDEVPPPKKQPTSKDG